MARVTPFNSQSLFEKVFVLYRAVFLNDFVVRGNVKSKEINAKILISFYSSCNPFSSIPFNFKKKKQYYIIYINPPPPPPPLWKSTKNTFPLKTPISARVQKNLPFFLLKFHNPSINLLSSILFAYRVTQFPYPRKLGHPKEITILDPSLSTSHDGSN